MIHIRTSIPRTIATVCILGVVAFSVTTAHAVCFCDAETDTNTAIVLHNGLRVAGVAGMSDHGGVVPRETDEEKTSKQFDYDPPLLRALEPRVRAGSDTTLVWNTGGRAMCELNGPQRFRHPDAAPLHNVWDALGLARFLGSSQYLAPEGSVNVHILRETRFTLSCYDPGRDGEELGTIAQSVVVRTLPVYPEI